MAGAAARAAGRVMAAAAAGAIAVAGLVAPFLLPAPAVAAPAQGGGEGLFEVQSARIPRPGSFSVAVTGAAYQVERRREPGSTTDRTVADGGVQLTAAFADRLEIWGRYGAALTRSGTTAFSYRDGLAGAKVALLRGPRLAVAAAGDVTIPWGNRERGFSSDEWDPSGTLLLTVPLSRPGAMTTAAVHLNAGYRRRGDDRGRTYDGFPLYYLEPVHPGGDGDRVDLRGAVELRARRITLFAEAILDRMASDDISPAEGPIWVTPGFRLSLGRRVSLLVASKIAISADNPDTDAFRPPEEMFPDWQIGFALTWSRFGSETDRDEDGAPDFRDRCPAVPEDPDGVADADGCPELDADGDGIPDEADACPEEPEDVDGDADEDGCPEAPPEPEEEQPAGGDDAPAAEEPPPAEAPAGESPPAGDAPPGDDPPAGDPPGGGD
jgi:hypothetical protein